MAAAWHPTRRAASRDGPRHKGCGIHRTFASAPIGMTMIIISSTGMVPIAMAMLPVADDNDHRQQQHHRRLLGGADACAGRHRQQRQSESDIDHRRNRHHRQGGVNVEGLDQQCTDRRRGRLGDQARHRQLAHDRGVVAAPKMLSGRIARAIDSSPMPAP